MWNISIGEIPPPLLAAWLQSLLCVAEGRTVMVCRPEATSFNRICQKYDQFSSKIQ